MQKIFHKTGLLGFHSQWGRKKIDWWVISAWRDLWRDLTRCFWVEDSTSLFKLNYLIFNNYSSIHDILFPIPLLTINATWQRLSGLGSSLLVHWPPERRFQVNRTVSERVRARWAWGSFSGRSWWIVYGCWWNVHPSRLTYSLTYPPPLVLD